METRALIQAVKRNLKRFPEDFMFRLTWEETNLLKPQSVILKEPSKTASRSQFVTLKRGKNVKYPPYALTEQGIAMLSSVLRSDRAIHVNIEIMRAFVRLRHILAAHADLARKLASLERKYDARFKKILPCRIYLLGLAEILRVCSRALASSAYICWLFDQNLQSN
jgi:hypothetical protein